MFDSDLSIQGASPTTWRTLAPLGWTGRRGERFTVPLGFETDFASVPRFLHWLVLPYGPYTRAAVLHDWLLTELAEWRKLSQAERSFNTVLAEPLDNVRKPPADSRDCDGIFRAAMADLGTPWAKRWTMWAAVRAASLFNPDRAYGRQFAKDAPKVLGMLALAANLPQLALALALGWDAKWVAAVTLLTGPVIPGAVGVLLSLGWVRVITMATGHPPVRMARRAPAGPTTPEGKRP